MRYIRLSTVCAYSYMYVYQMCTYLKDCDCVYFLFNFIKRLLFLSIDDIIGDEAVISGDPLPHSYVLNFLFSRAPSEMRSPYQVKCYLNLYIVLIPCMGGVAIHVGSEVD